MLGTIRRRPLVDQIRAALDSSRFPLFVSEGNSDSKLDRINHSAYLHKCFRNFRQSLQHKVALFIYGHSLASSDDHILEQIVKAKFPQVFISLYSDPASPEGREIIARGNALATAREMTPPSKSPFTMRDPHQSGANLGMRAYRGSNRTQYLPLFPHP